MGTPENLKLDMIKQRLYYDGVRLAKITERYKMSETCQRDILAVAESITTARDELGEL